MRDHLAGRSTTIALLFVVAVLAALFDPYTFGDEGGEFGLASHAWQVVYAASQAVLLVVAANYARFGSYRRAVSFATIEGALFLIANAAYVLRDGTTRFAAGYTADSTVVLAIAIGIGARCLAITLLLRRVRSSLSAA